MAKLMGGSSRNMIAEGQNGKHFRLFSALFSRAALRRKLFDAIGCGVSRQQHDQDPDDEEDDNTSQMRQQPNTMLSEILKCREREDAEMMLEEVQDEINNNKKRKAEALEQLKGVVKRLQVEHQEEECNNKNKMMEAAALDVRRLAKDDSDARETLAMLGAIPPLVAMLDPASYSLDSQIASLYALLNLAIGNDMNKAAVVKAGGVHKMLNLIDHGVLCEAIVANFLGLSALDSNKPILATSGAIPFLVNTLKLNLSKQAQQDCLRAIYNLSILPSTMSLILQTNLLPFLLNALGDMEVSDWILSILSNVVSAAVGRKAISDSADAFPILIDALNWNDSPACQEKASYILMVMAHKSYGDRQAMLEAGIMSSLLELTLIGSPLAQKRASRILECLRVDKGKQIRDDNNNPHSHPMQGGGGPISAPIVGSSSLQQQQHNADDDEEEMSMSEERKAVKQLVQLSLQDNMRRIVKRANLPQDFVPSEHFKSLTTTATSKSLPF